MRYLNARSEVEDDGARKTSAGLAVSIFDCTASTFDGSHKIDKRDERSDREGEE